MPRCLLVDRAWYSYDGGRSWALRGASLALEPGALVLVTGPNGAGKTTLLKVAGLIYRPQRGRVLVDGADFWSSGSIELRRRVVYVHETPVMLRGTVLDNIAYGLLIRGLDREEALSLAREAAELLGLRDVLGEKASRLSAGLRQLVAIARALAVKPSYLLLDEPFAHLDSSRRSVLASVIAGLTEQGVGVAVATHYAPKGLEPSTVLEVVDGATRSPQPVGCRSS